MNLGVIIGRFQIPELHESHVELIKYVQARHDQVMVFLGCSPVVASRRNPLDFITREKMIRDSFPTVSVMPIMDQPSDELWSQIVDCTARNVCPVGNIVLYGGRDSFIPHYKGASRTVEVDMLPCEAAGTKIRETAANKILVSSDFRAGVIYSAYNQYGRVFPTVDIALIREGKVLMGKKPNEDRYRFPGGFVDQEDLTLEDAAKREAMEETGLEVLDLAYIGSLRSTDWRYRSKEDGRIHTTLFVSHHPFFRGAHRAGDDIGWIQWFPLDQSLQFNVVECHVPLVKMLIKAVQNET